MHFTRTWNSAAVGWVTEETEESEKLNKYLKVRQKIAGSSDYNAIVKVLSPFFVRTAKPTGGTEVPHDVNEPEVVFAQMLGLTTQAGIVKVVTSVMK